MELAGLPLDSEQLIKQKTQLGDIKSSLEKEWQQLVPDIKYTQRDKLLQHLNEQYGLDLTSLTKASLAPHKDNPVVTARRKLEAIAVKLNQLKAFERSAFRDGRVHTIYRILTGEGTIQQWRWQLLSFC